MLTNDDLSVGKTFLIDKPKSWTSFDVIRKIQGYTRYKKIGHAGTLDPLATGLLILCTGKNTKKIHNFQDQEKEYDVELVLGAVTKSYDAEFEPENFTDTLKITKKQVEQVVQNYFFGSIIQIPPAFSAVKVNGQRAYKLARKNKEVKLKERTIKVKKFQIISFEKDERQNPTQTNISAKIICSKGTYIRSLIHDLGQKLGVGGYIKELRRTRIGTNKIEDAFTLDELLNKLTKV